MPAISNAIPDKQEFSKWKSSAPFWSIALVLGLIQAWANRFYMGSDGVPYLDMADAYLRRDWHTAINGSWNPLYAWLIGSDFLIFRPSAYWEYPTVQLLNFGIYAVTVASFEYFLRGWLRWRGGNEVAVRMIAYALFLWSTLILIGVWTVNADMLVAACIYGALGLMLRAYSSKTASTLQALILSLIITIGYYGKAVMFPIGMILLLVALNVFQWKRTLIMASIFILLSAPLIAGLSRAVGHLTFGETGRVNYAWYVNGVAKRWWQGGPARAGQPLHPPRITLDSPRVYDFDGAFPKATYPLWYNFAYWYQGVRTWIDPLRIAAVTWSNLKWTMKLLLEQGGGFLLGWGTGFLLYKNKGRIFKDLAFMWPAWAVGVAAIMLYCSVHIESRYIGAFGTVLLLTAFSSIDIRRKGLAVGVVVAGLLWAMMYAPEPTLGARYFPPRGKVANVSWQAATELEQLGLHANDKVASVCYSNRGNILWARLARAHIVAETDWAVDFWRLSDADQQRVLAALRGSGAMMAVSDETPPDPAHAVGWRRAGNTNYYAYPLSRL
ncbi:MAG: hypothetical protein WB952_12175 [Terriglobales bacterium]